MFSKSSTKISFSSEHRAALVTALLRARTAAAAAAAASSAGPAAGPGQPAAAAAFRPPGTTFAGTITSSATASGNDYWVDGKFKGDPYCAAYQAQREKWYPETYVDGIGEDAIKYAEGPDKGTSATPFKFANGCVLPAGVPLVPAGGRQLLC